MGKKILVYSLLFPSCQARRDLNDPENAIIGAFAGTLITLYTSFLPFSVNHTKIFVEQKNLANRWS